MKILALTPVSVTVELENTTTPFFSSDKFIIRINGQNIREENRNVFSVFNLSGGANYELEAAGERINFQLPPKYTAVSVYSFGAKGDGKHDDTSAFQAAVNCLPEGYLIYVPAGRYSVRPIFLKSGVTVFLDKCATLLGNPDRENYPVLPGIISSSETAHLTAEREVYGYKELNLGTWQGEEVSCFASLFTACGQKNISIIGEGVIDCNAPSGDWYENHRVKRGAWRPRGVFFNRCENVLMQGITVKNTPSWNIHPYFCKRVKLYDLTLENPPDMPTTDGVDPDCCNGVDIAGVKISVGDDCIAIKSGTFETAKKYRTPCKNINIHNCLMRDGHGGVVFGSELSGGIQNVTVDKCLFDGTDRGLRIKTRRGRGRIGKCGAVIFSDIVMKNVKVPFVINMFYNMGDENGHGEYVWTTEKLPVDERTPEIGSFTFKNIVCTGAEYSAGAFYGLPESPIKSITFENVSFSYNPDANEGFPDMREKNFAVKKQGLDFRCVEKVVLKNVEITGQTGEPVLCENVKEIKKF